MSWSRIIPKGVAIMPNGEWEYNEEIGVRETPGDCVAFCELTQEICVVDEDFTETQHIALTLGQMLALRDYFTLRLNEHCSGE